MVLVIAALFVFVIFVVTVLCQLAWAVAQFLFYFAREVFRRSRSG